MEKRPLPTKRIIDYAIGNNKFFSEYILHGLEETSLEEFYSNLNLEEVLAFSGISFLERKKNLKDFRQKILNEEMYEIFKEILGRGIPLLRSSKKYDFWDEQKYRDLNPYGNKKNLALRIQRVNLESIEILRERLMLPTKEYIFEKDYDYYKTIGKIESQEAKLMGIYGNASSEKIISYFNGGISRILRSYTRNWEPLEEREEEQISLFS
jgi:hypothetical protein